MESAFLIDFEKFRFSWIGENTRWFLLYPILPRLSLFALPLLLLPILLLLLLRLPLRLYPFFAINSVHAVVVAKRSAAQWPGNRVQGCKAERVGSRGAGQKATAGYDFN